MPGHKYVEDISSVQSCLATKMLAGIAPEGEPKGHVQHVHLCHSGFETAEKTSPEIQNKGISGPTKMTYVFQKLKKNTLTISL